MQNILIPIKINGERRRWNGSALSAASGGQPSATQRDIITHLWLKEISLDFLEFFWWQCCFDKKKQPSTTQRDISTHLWLRKCKYFNLNFPRIFWVKKKNGPLLPTDQRYPPQAVLHSFAYCETGGAKLSPFLWQCGHEMCKWEPVFSIYI